MDSDLPAVFVDFLKLKLFNARNSIVDRQAAVCEGGVAVGVGNSSVETAGCMWGMSRHDLCSTMCGLDRVLERG